MDAIPYYPTGELRTDAKFKYTLKVYEAAKPSLRLYIDGETAVSGANLYPYKKEAVLDIHSFGNLATLPGNWFEFSMFNQLPGLPQDNVPGFSGHYSVRFNPYTGEIACKKFGDYANFMSYVPVEADWEYPVHPALCTYLRRHCRHAWDGAYRNLCVELSLDDSGVIVYKARRPVNVHTGEAYRNCYYLLTQMDLSNGTH